MCIRLIISELYFNIISEYSEYIFLIYGLYI